MFANRGGLSCFIIMSSIYFLGGEVKVSHSYSLPLFYAISQPYFQSLRYSRISG